MPRGHARVVLHDLRSGGPTDGATQMFDLGEVDGAANNHLGLYIPPGVAHGLREPHRHDHHLSGGWLLQSC
ncbi:MAG: hypothetical protein R2735_14660 [Microthrixaceae bacterium]